MEQKYAHRVCHSERVVRIYDPIDENTNQIIVIVVLGSRRSANQFLSFSSLEGYTECGNDYVLKNNLARLAPALERELLAADDRRMLLIASLAAGGISLESVMSKKIIAVRIPCSAVK